MGNKLTLLSACLFTGITLFAQKDSAKSTLLDEVIVTANKVEQKQSQTGKVVTVIGKAQLEQSANKSVAQVLNEQAGLVINGALNNTGSVQTLYMRGASAGRTLILIDGIPVNEPSTITNDYDLNLFSINDVERIEICKGAQSTLYGSDAVAGVINIITVKNNVTKPFEGKATLTAGSFNTHKANVQLYGKLNKFTYTARYAKLTTNGFGNAYDSTGANNFDKDGYNGNVANATVQFAANKYLNFKAFTLYSQYKSDIDAGVFADKKAYFIDNNSSISGAGFHFKKDVVTLVGNYQYTKLNRLYDDNYSAGAALFALNKYHAISQFAELYTNVQLGAGFTLLSGADYRYGSYHNAYNSVSVFGPYNSDFTDTSVSQTSMYASLSFIDANKHFSVELGGRLNTHSRYNFNYTYTFNPAYNFNDHWRIFGSIATGFKAPGLYQLSLNPQLLPEESINYEAGVQFQHKQVQTRLVYFNRKTDNGIDYNYITYNFFNYVKQQVNGLEYELTVKPVEQLSISGNYSLLIGEETSQNRVTNKDTVTYDYLLRRPKHVANLTVGVQPLKALQISCTAKYVSARKDVGGYAKADVGLASYWIAGANVSYELNEQIKFFADVQNATNARFFDVRGYNAIPRMLNAGITVRW